MGMLRLTRLFEDGVTRDAEGNVTVRAPVADARGAALLVSPARPPEVDAAGPICTRCRGRDVVIVIQFPSELDAEPLRFCRACVDRPPGQPLTIMFR
jgi:hypothetical protein